MVSEVSTAEGDSKHWAGFFQMSVPQFFLIKSNYHWGSFNSKLNLETLTLLSRYIPICLPNERATSASFSELWWGMAVQAWSMTDSQCGTSPSVDHVHWVGMTTSQRTTPDASRSGKGDGKHPALGSSVSACTLFGFRLEASCGASGLAKPRKYCTH